MNFTNKFIKKTVTLILTGIASFLATSTTHAELTRDHIMMDENNMLKLGSWFLPEITYAESGTKKATITAKFKLPERVENPSCVLKAKRSDIEKTVNAGNITYDEQTKTYSSSPFEIDFGNYEVLLYNGDPIEKNLVAKSETSVLNNLDELNHDVYTFDVFDSNGTLIDSTNKPKLTASLYDVNQTRQASITIPKKLMPRGTFCLKVVVFANETIREGAPIDISMNCFEMFDNGVNSHSSDEPQHQIVTFVGSMNWPDALQDIYAKTYEYHFYANEIKPENFICKCYDTV